MCYINIVLADVIVLYRLMHRMRDAARKMEEKHFSDRTTEHVEFLPVEWRSKLSLDGGNPNPNPLHLKSEPFRLKSWFHYSTELLIKQQDQNWD